MATNCKTTLCFQQFLWFLSESDRDADKVSLAYADQEQQDLLLCTWLLSIISNPVLSKVFDCRHSWQVWEAVHDYFHSLTKTKSHQFHSKLRYLTKCNCTIFKFFLRVCAIAEALVSIGDPVPDRDQFELILEALPEEHITHLLLMWIVDQNRFSLMNLKR